MAIALAEIAAPVGELHVGFYVLASARDRDAMIKAPLVERNNTTAEAAAILVTLCDL